MEQDKINKGVLRKGIGMKQKIKQLLNLMLSIVLVAGMMGNCVYAEEIAISEEVLEDTNAAIEENGDHANTLTVDLEEEDTEESVPAEEYDIIDTVEEEEPLEDQSTDDEKGESEGNEEDEIDVIQPDSIIMENDILLEGDRLDAIEEADDGTGRKNPDKEEIKLMGTSETVAGSHMWYQYNGNIDIRGYSNGEVIQTTFSDYGYYTKLLCDGVEENLNFNDNGDTVRHDSGITVTPYVSFSEDGTYAIVKYIVRNTTNARKTYSLGVVADVDIDYDDYASVYRTNNGFMMVNKEGSGRTYYCVCRNISGSPNANTSWIGEYALGWENAFTDSNVTELHDTDSMLAFSWSNKTILAGSTATYVYQIGIGENGAIVDYSETGKGFRIGVDTNGFNHSLSDFFIGSYLDASHVNFFEKLYYKFTKLGKYITESDRYFIVGNESEPGGITYKTSDNYYNRLVSGLSKSQKNTILDKMNAYWGGSCHGIAISMALASQGVNLSESGITTNYYNAGAPKYNKDLRNAINFYQLSQFTPIGGETKIVYNESYNRIMKDQSLHSFLESLANEAMRSEEEGKPFVLSFGYTHGNEQAGHSIVVYGASKRSDSSYIIDLYDENGSKDIDMSVDTFTDTFSFTDGNGNNIMNSTYNYLSYTGIDRLYSSISTMEADEENDSINDGDTGEIDPENSETILISANKKCKIINDRNEYLTYDGESYSGTMTVYNMRVVGEGDSQEIMFYVAPYTSLRLEEMEQKEIKLSGSVGGEYYTVETEGSDAVDIVNGNIQISGEEYTFTAGTSAGYENSDLVCVSAQKTGETKLASKDGKITIDSPEKLSEAIVTTYTDTTTSEKELAGETETLTIQDSEEGEVKILQNNEAYDLSLCTMDLTPDEFTFNGEECKPSVGVKYGSLELKEGEHYSLVYENNINPGTAKVRIIAKGNCTGTNEKSFTIRPVTIPVKSISLNKNTATLEEGKTITLKEAISPSNATDKTVSWSSSDKKVATVSSKGVVKGIKKGTATISVTSKDGKKKASCRINVSKKKVAVKSVKLNKKGTLNLKVGKAIALKATIVPANATNKAVRWVTSNKKVVTVSKKGVVKAVKKGKASITVITADGKKKSSCRINVK